jgi:ABC-type transport system involved in cytochrome bd biosynthesis fused ATPase/permease subunit
MQLLNTPGSYLSGQAEQQQTLQQTAQQWMEQAQQQQSFQQMTQEVMSTYSELFNITITSHYEDRNGEPYQTEWTINPLLLEGSSAEKPSTHSSGE